MTFRLVGFSVALVSLLAVSDADAATIYQYQGNQFDTVDAGFTSPCTPLTGMCPISNVTVTLEFATALAAGLSLANVSPDSWSISDGLTTITNLTAGIATTSPNFFLQVGTDGSGSINKWYIDINPTNPSAVMAGNWSGTRTISPDAPFDDQTRYCQEGSCTNQAVARDHAQWEDS